MVPSGDWGFRSDYEAELQRRRREHLDQIKREEKAELIANETDREIARLLRARESEQSRDQELDRLLDFSRQYQASTAKRLMGERVSTAYARAATQGNRSALEALDREMARANEEEEFTMLATMMVLNGTI